jgi:hypothetical protein
MNAYLIIDCSILVPLGRACKEQAGRGTGHAIAHVDQRTGLPIISLQLQRYCKRCASVRLAINHFENSHASFLGNFVRINHVGPSALHRACHFASGSQRY